MSTFRTRPRRRSTTRRPGRTHVGSGSADNLNTTLTREVTRPTPPRSTLSANRLYEIEEGFDYLYGEVLDRRRQPPGPMPASRSAQPRGTWTDISLSPRRLRPAEHCSASATPPMAASHHAGPFLDDIAITLNGATVSTDDVESGDNGWTVDGFTRIHGHRSPRRRDYYYLAREPRSTSGYDNDTPAPARTTSPSRSTKPDWVELFPVPARACSSGWSTTRTRTTTRRSPRPRLGPPGRRPAEADQVRRWRPADQPSSAVRRDVRPGQGEEDLPAQADPLRQPQRLQTLEACTAASPGIATFNDSDPARYWNAANPQNSTLVSGLGVRATVVKDKKGHLEVKVSNPAAQ